MHNVQLKFCISIVPDFSCPKKKDFNIIMLTLENYTHTLYLFLLNTFEAYKTSTNPFRLFGKFSEQIKDCCNPTMFWKWKLKKENVRKVFIQNFFVHWFITSYSKSCEWCHNPVTPGIGLHTQSLPRYTPRVFTSSRLLLPFKHVF